MKLCYLTMAYYQYKREIEKKFGWSLMAILIPCLNVDQLIDHFITYLVEVSVQI